MNVRRTVLRALAASAAGGLATLALAGPAAAHVTVTPSTTAAGAYTVLTVGVGHGCEASPTTSIAIQMPEEILSVTPARHPLWDVTVQTEKLDEPVADAHGNEVTERDAVVVYTAKQPLPDGIRDSFELSVKLPDAEGETLAFPAIQTCAKGRTAWTEIAAEGQDPDELETPAPLVTITAAEGDGSQAAERADGTTEQSAADDHGNGQTMGAVGLGAGVLGLVAGGTALARVQRRS